MDSVEDGREWAADREREKERGGKHQSSNQTEGISKKMKHSGMEWMLGNKPREVGIEKKRNMKNEN